MIEHHTPAPRPHPTMLLLLAPALLAVSHQTGRYWIGALILLAAVAAYRVPLSIASHYSARMVASIIFFALAYVLSLGTERVLPGVFPSAMFAACALWLALTAGGTWYGMGRIFGPWWLVMVTGLLLTLAGNMEPGWVYTVCVWSWVLATVWLLSTPGSPLAGRSQGRARIGPQTLALAAALVVAAGAYLALNSLVHTLEIWLTRMIDQAAAGSEGPAEFGGGVDLRAEMPAKLSGRVALRVTGSRPPDHLRGEVLLTYRAGHWYNALSRYRPGRAAPPEWLQAVSAAGRPMASATSLGPGAAGAAGWWWLHVEAVAPNRGIIFAPPGARLTAVPGVARVDDYAIARQPAVGSHLSFDVAGDGGRLISSLPPSRGADLQVPEQLREELRFMALEWVQGATSDQSRADAIEGRFRSRFHYSLQVANQPGVDPILDFLAHERPAYCSYFASGMTLLLRSLGVPAHVVTGYVSAEYNRYGGFYVVREREAHAWVEVYARQSGGWVTYDPTPPDMKAVLGLDEPTRAGALRDYMGWWLASRWEAFIAADLSGRLRLVGRALDLAVRWPGTWALAALWLAVWWWRRRGVARQAEAAARPARALTPPEMAPLLARLEDALRTNGVPVAADHTCSDWLQALSAAHLPPDRRQALAQAILDYQKHRFDPTSGAAHRQELEQHLTTINSLGRVERGEAGHAPRRPPAGRSK